MTNIIKFETKEMESQRFMREIKPEMTALSKKMDKKLSGGDLSTRAELEARMIKALADGDDAEFDKVTNLIERLDASKIDNVITQ